jgi:glycine dehydrogenase subunit 2
MFRQAVFPRQLMADGEERTVTGVEGLLPPGMSRSSIRLPEKSESEVVRHFTALSNMNFGTDNGPYPLGSCTMKYNPKYADRIAHLADAVDVHPYQPEGTVQGSLQIMHEMEKALCSIGGVDAVTLQPAAGAHGEHTSMLIVRAFHRHNGQERDEVIIPDSAHGTNPASAAMAGFKLIEIPSSEDGCVDLEALEAALSERTAAMMLTNPNTLGIFERQITRVAEMVHAAGALLYYDGANLNAIMGYSTPGDMDFDIVHFNVHKTFASPHGGGGPGAGPVGVKSFLEPFLPSPRVVEQDGIYSLDRERPLSIGKVSTFQGNFGVILRGYAYILRQGGDGLKRATEGAVLNSNYLKERLKAAYDIPYGDLKKHEFVASAASLKERRGIRAMDVAKMMMDHGLHPPTVYFPMLVEEALMIEPTEDESKETLDMMAEVLLRIAGSDSETAAAAPSSTTVTRVDETKAARDAILSTRYQRRKAGGGT